MDEKPNMTEADNALLDAIDNFDYKEWLKDVKALQEKDKDLLSK